MAKIKPEPTFHTTTFDTADLQETLDVIIMAGITDLLFSTRPTNDGLIAVTVYVRDPDDMTRICAVLDLDDTMVATITHSHLISKIDELFIS